MEFGSVLLFNLMFVKKLNLRIMQLSSCRLHSSRSFCSLRFADLARSDNSVKISIEMMDKFWNQNRWTPRKLEAVLVLKSCYFFLIQWLVVMFIVNDCWFFNCQSPDHHLFRCDYFSSSCEKCLSDFRISAHTHGLYKSKSLVKMGQLGSAVHNFGF